jgi:hypothetical protein
MLVNPESIDADLSNWLFFGVEMLTSHEEGAARNPAHILDAFRFDCPF